MEKIDTLLDLWKYRCDNYIYVQDKKAWSLNEEIIKWQKAVKNQKKDIKPYIDDDIAFAAESLLKREPFTTKVLYKLLKEDTDFSSKFFKKIGFGDCNYSDVTIKTEYPEKIKDPEIQNYQNNYDLFFESEKKICILENKLDAEFSKKEGNIPAQLKRYHNALKKSSKSAKILVTLTVFNVEDDEQFQCVRDKLCPESGVQLINLYWYQIIKLLESIQENKRTKLQQQALDLFCKDYFLLQASGYSCYKKTFDTTFFMEKIEEFCENNKIRYRKREKLHAITLLAPNKNYKDSWYGNLSGLSIWLDGYAVKGGKEDKDNDNPRELKTKAFPFFDVVLRCYWQVENAAIEKSKIDKLKDCDYKECVVYDEKGNIKHQYFRKALSEQIRILDETSLEKINNADSDFWEFLKKEISQWQEIVCGNKS